MGFDIVKNYVVNFKLDFCCWFFPVKIGLLLTGYFNAISAAISILGIADESFTPLISQLQAGLMGDDGTKPAPILAYIGELCFSVVLLCGVHREDMPLLRVYMKYCFLAITMSVLFYSMVVPVIGAIVTTAMLFSIIFQIYVLILVRSMLVQIRLKRKMMELPTLVMSTIIEEEKEKVDKENEVDVEVDVEAPAETEVHVEVNDENKSEDKLETVDEHPKEEVVQTPVFHTVRRV